MSVYFVYEIIDINIQYIKINCKGLGHLLNFLLAQTPDIRGELVQ